MRCFMELFLLCLKIFCVRIMDVSLGTARTIITVKGKSLLASTIGFFEVFIWFIIVREALNTDETSILIAISYSLGFAVGTFVGSKLSNKFIQGNLNIQVITRKKEIAKDIRKEGYGVSILNVTGQEENEKYMLLIEINNNKMTELNSLIRKLDKDAFLMVTETKLVQNGYFK